jgi:hypothetical protein
VVAVPDLKAPKPEYLHQLSAGLRFQLGQSKRLQPTNLSNNKTAPLAISISSPRLKAGQKYQTTDASILIAGRVSNPASIKELQIQGKKVAVGKKGDFSATVKLALGETTIVITAIDLNNKKNLITIVAQRKSK